MRLVQLTIAQVDQAVAAVFDLDERTEVCQVANTSIPPACPPGISYAGCPKDSLQADAY